jgi:hypothetical protein
MDRQAWVGLFVVGVIVAAFVAVAGRGPAPGLDALDPDGAALPSLPGTAPIALPSVPIAASPAPDDAHTRLLRTALASSGVPIDRLVQLFDRGEGVVLGIVVRGDEALAIWQVLRSHVAETEHWPVVIGGGDELGMLRELVEGAPAPSVILAEASALDVDAWLAQRRASVGAMLPHGAWPALPSEPAGTAALTIGRDILSGQPQAEVAIALVPTRESADAAAWLGFGAYNDCPTPAVHVALFRRWHARFGAEVYGLSGSVAELLVSRPPTDREAALALAEEHGAYAYDLVAQGTESIEALAATRLGARSWYFWWD